MICFALDTGCRIDEMLTLERGSVDFDNMLVTVIGKGDKERIIPISIEGRKQLFKFLKSHDFSYVFPTRHGDKITYKTCLDQLKEKFWYDACWLGAKTGLFLIKNSFLLFFLLGTSPVKVIFNVIYLIVLIRNAFRFLIQVGSLIFL